MNLLIIHKTQFGYHNNAYKLCQYLHNRIDITYLCFDGREKIDMEGITIKYIPANIPKIFRASLFMLASLWTVFFWRGGIMIYYFPGCEWYKKVIPHKKMLLDVRTLSVTEDEYFNKKQDIKLKEAAEKFDFVTFLSEGMRNKIGFPHKNSAIVPLGADMISDLRKNYYPIKLLYVGTLGNRHLEKTLEGLMLFVKKHPDIPIQYHIVGNAEVKQKQQELLLHEYVKKHNMDGFVKFYGKIPNRDLKPFFDMCNFGVSFVPITSFYNNQPVTKTFEYAMSGLYVLGTATAENAKVINPDNGIIIRDSAESFYETLVWLVDNYNQISYDKITSSLIQYRWETIENKIMLPILENLFF